MTSCTLRNHGLAFILVLILCQILDYATSQTLSFVDLIRPFEIVQIIHFEDLVAGLVSVALVVCVLLYFFASQSTVYKAILVTTLLSLFVLILNAIGLLRSLIDRRIDPVYLLIDAAIVYITTVLVFPQNATTFPGYENWKPGFVDYLFLSFNTSATFGPTDTLILSPRAKCMMICQVALSLIVLIVLAARAVGILR